MSPDPASVTAWKRQPRVPLAPPTPPKVKPVDPSAHYFQLYFDPPAPDIPRASTAPTPLSPIQHKPHPNAFLHDVATRFRSQATFPTTRLLQPTAADLVAPAHATQRMWFQMGRAGLTLVQAAARLQYVTDGHAFPAALPVPPPRSMISTHRSVSQNEVRFLHWILFFTSCSPPPTCCFLQAILFRYVL